MIDTHAHLNFSIFDQERDSLLSELLSSDIQFINVGTNYYSSQKAIEIAEGFSQGVYASVGFHPLNIESDFTIKKYGSNGEKENKLEKDFDFGSYKKLAEAKKVVAIGEAGLDYWTKPKGAIKKEEYKKKQRIVFEEQIGLAKETGLPLIVHSRMAFEDTVQILRKSKPKGVMHCFVGNAKELDDYLELGYYIGINGIIFKLDLQEAIRNIPLDRLLLETDCPYLPPSGFGEVNNPFSLEIIVQEIAEIRNMDVERIKEAATNNAKKLFKI